MAKPVTHSELLRQLAFTTKERAEIRAMTNKMLAQLRLGELRKEVGITQEEMAERLKVSQAAVAKVERGGEVQVSTLDRYVKAMGGRLEVAAIFPDRAIRLHHLPLAPSRKRKAS